MKEYEKIERYVNDLLTVMGIDKDGEEQLLWLFLHHACCAAAIYEVLDDDTKPVYTEMLKKLNYFFSSKISVKQRKRRKEKENFPPYPLLKEKDKKEKGEKIYTHIQPSAKLELFFRIWTSARRLSRWNAGHVVTNMTGRCWPTSSTTGAM